MGGTPRLQVAFARPELAHWEEPIARLLELPSEQTLADAVADVLWQAGVEHRAGTLTFQLEGVGQRDVDCGAWRARVEQKEQGLSLLVQTPNGHLQRLVMWPTAAGAAIVLQWFAVVASGLPARPSAPPGRVAVRFASDPLAARSGALSAALGVSSPTEWLEELFAELDLRIVRNSAQPTWTATGEIEVHVPGNRSVFMTPAYGGTELNVVVARAGRPLIGLVLKACPHGGAEIIVEMWDARPPRDLDRVAGD